MPSNSSPFGLCQDDCISTREINRAFFQGSLMKVRLYDMDGSKEGKALSICHYGSMEVRFREEECLQWDSNMLRKESVIT